MIPGSNGGNVAGGRRRGKLGFTGQYVCRAFRKFFSGHGGCQRQIVRERFQLQRCRSRPRNFFEMFPSQILAVQATAQIIDGTAPFQDLAHFGGQDFLRGYFDGQYRDKTEVGGQVEYRIPVWWRFGAVGFAGVAQVADKMSRWSLDEFKFAGGAGIRFVLKHAGTHRAPVRCWLWQQFFRSVFHRYRSFLTCRYHKDDRHL